MEQHLLLSPHQQSWTAYLCQFAVVASFCQLLLMRRKTSRILSPGGLCPRIRQFWLPWTREPEAKIDLPRGPHDAAYISSPTSDNR